MKTQLSKPARSRASYTEEYKKEALELWRNSGRRVRGTVSLAQWLLRLDQAPSLAESPSSREHALR
jgi:hypothetical protein